MKKYLLLIILGFSLAFTAGAQSLAPSVLGTAGDHAQAGGIQLSFTAGEAGGVTTATAGGIILTQGFQQVDPVNSSTGSGKKPTIYVTANLATFTTTAGTPSSSQSFSVSGSDLTANISLSAPSQFEISLASGSGYGSSLSLTPTSGTVAATVIYVRYNPSVAGQHSGNISCSSTGATTENVAVNGTTGNPAPIIITSVNALNAFTTTAGTPSSSVGFTVTGNNLTGNLILTAPTHFEVSLSSGSGFGSSVSFTPTSGKVNNQTVYVRYNPSASGSHSGNVVASSTGATAQNVAVSGNSTGNPIPSIITSVSSLNAFTTSIGTPSAVQNFTVSGSDLSANLTVTAPSQYEVSLNSTSGFGSSVSFTPSAGVVSNGLVYVRYNPSVAGPHSGKIAAASSGAVTQNVLVNGSTSGTVSPVITTSVSSLNAFSTQVGTPSTAQLYTVIGTDLNGLLVVSAPADFQVSLTSASGFGGSVYFNPTAGKVNNGTVYVRYNPTTAGNHSGKVDNVSSGATTVSVSVSGTATIPAGPAVTATNISSSFTTQIGTPSAAQAMAVSGSNLTGNVSVVSPTNFEVSLSAGSGFTNSLSITPAGGTVSTTIIYVRYNPGTAGPHNGSVVVSSQGANSQSISVDGNTTVGIESVSGNINSFSLYPNPTRNVVNISYSLNRNSPVQISIYDMQGREITSSNVAGASAGVYSSAINTSSFPQGMYILKLYTDDGAVSAKFVKE